jgi:hypothetical protein
MIRQRLAPMIARASYSIRDRELDAPPEKFIDLPVMSEPDLLHPVKPRAVSAPGSAGSRA